MELNRPTSKVFQISIKKSPLSSVGIIKELSGHKLDRTPEVIEAWKDGRSRKRLQRRLQRFALVFGNLAVVVGLVGFIYVSSNQNTSSPAVLDIANSQSNQVASKPLDQISSADIAVSLARVGRFEEVYWVAEQAASVEYLSELPVSADPVAEKPQVVNSTIRTRKDISTYVVGDGDTLDSIAKQYAVTKDSIKWSNGLNNNVLEQGQELLIPPQGLNGIVYVVEEGDTIDALAKKYQVSKSRLISFNDVESGELPVGEAIFLQDATQPYVRPTYLASTASQVTTRPTINGTVSSAGYTPIYGPNGYAYGHCTYYIATKTGAPNGLGNANTWDNRAPAFGYTVSKTPVAGAIAQRDWGSYYGHLAYVEAVSADGTMIKYSDMNGLGGWNRVYYSDWVPVSEYNVFIY